MVEKKMGTREAINGNIYNNVLAHYMISLQATVLYIFIDFDPFPSPSPHFMQ